MFTNFKISILSKNGKNGNLSTKVGSLGKGEGEREKERERARERERERLFQVEIHTALCPAVFNTVLSHTRSA